MGNRKHKSYLVKWEIDVTASSPEEAAKQALEIQRDINSEALNFDVEDGNNNYNIDLLQIAIEENDRLHKASEFLSIDESDDLIHQVIAIEQQAKVDGSVLIHDVDGVTPWHKITMELSCDKFLQLIS